MIEGCDLLDGDLLARWFMHGGASDGGFWSAHSRSIAHFAIFNSPYDSISTLTDDILNIVLLADIERDLSGTAAPLLNVAHGWIAGSVISARDAG